MNIQVKSVDTNSEPPPLTFSIPMRRILETVWEDRKSVASIAAAIFVTLVFGKLFVAPSYTSTAVVQVGMLDRELLEQDSALTTEPNIARLRSPVVADLANLESQEARLLASEGLARAVVVRLGLDKSQSESKLGLLLSALGRVLPVQYTAPSNTDIATQKFMSYLDVRNEPRSNLIRVSATASKPEEAALRANAVLAEYVHYRTSQMLALRKSRATALIADLSVVYGENHPSILQAKGTLTNTEAALDAYRASTPPNDSGLAALGYVMPARPDYTPSGITLNAMILIAMIVGVLVGIAYVLARTFLFAKKGTTKWRLADRVANCMAWVTRGDG